MNTLIRKIVSEVLKEEIGRNYHSLDPTQHHARMVVDKYRVSYMNNDTSNTVK